MHKTTALPSTEINPAVNEHAAQWGLSPTSGPMWDFNTATFQTMLAQFNASPPHEKVQKLAEFLQTVMKISKPYGQFEHTLPPEFIDLFNETFPVKLAQGTEKSEAHPVTVKKIQIDSKTLPQAGTEAYAAQALPKSPYWILPETLWLAPHAPQSFNPARSSTAPPPHPVYTLYAAMPVALGVELCHLVMPGEASPEKQLFLDQLGSKGEGLSLTEIPHISRIKIVLNLFKALQELHTKHEWIHHDLKSNNLFLTEDLRVILMGFGMSHDQTDCISASVSKGSVNYAATELFLERPVTDPTLTPSIDAFSAGVVAQEILTAHIILEFTLFGPAKLAHIRWEDLSKSNPTQNGYAVENAALIVDGLKQSGFTPEQTSVLTEIITGLHHPLPEHRMTLETAIAQLTPLTDAAGT